MVSRKGAKARREEARRVISREGAKARREEARREEARRVISREGAKARRREGAKGGGAKGGGFGLINGYLQPVYDSFKTIFDKPFIIINQKSEFDIG